MRSHSAAVVPHVCSTHCSSRSADTREMIKQHLWPHSTDLQPVSMLAAPAPQLQARASEMRWPSAHVIADCGDGVHDVAAC